ncbi:Serine-type D-Ala-D-Ala carboxypeptidase [Alkaliphilus metalliredigens QYMF]|uniref:serine-type D-Ala-D-Ala carboxypeptidase n=1 Tax=Alkaliphilus metalliredigens (strain QYMF) TaxID=293826 RepID=A6TQK8_ALKMQ|nr:D-alanyl-D-alanine carboxypeptidase family protein [Alkaliphilus metalliredigens]ABR48476.1 Serine-type D-Ala-D-Ala carboxypeptidase [Alkaliphilus metalliredigens QYMF]
MKKSVSLFLTCVITLIFMFNPDISHGEGKPSITAPNGVLLDFQTGEVLYDKNAHEITYPASTTKALTAILVLENLELDEVITVEEDMFVGGSGMYLLKGEAFTVNELLHVLMIRSANDVAELLATHISGSVEAFADLMNRRAKELGALNSHFTNPHGLPDEEHVTTAYDLAMIGKHAITFDVLREIAGTVRYDVEPTEFTPETRYYRNTNRFLWGTGSGNQILYRGQYQNIKYDIVEGLKTGFTNAAQNCLIASAIQGDQRFISVVLGAQGVNVYADSRALIDYGFENYQLVQLVEEQHYVTTEPLLKGVEDEVSLYSKDSLTKILPIDVDPSLIEKQLIINDELSAPILLEETYGKIIYSLGGEILGEVELVPIQSIELKSFSRTIIEGLRRPMVFVGGFLVVLVFWQLFIAHLRFRKRRSRGMSYGRRKGYSFSKNLMK